MTTEISRPGGDLICYLVITESTSVVLQHHQRQRDAGICKLAHLDLMRDAINRLQHTHREHTATAATVTTNGLAKAGMSITGDYQRCSTTQVDYVITR
jgi:hypothetical protein